MTGVSHAGACCIAGGEVRCFQRPADSGRTVSRWVCSECGTCICSGAKLDAEQLGTFVLVRAGTSWVSPTAHFWTRSARPWVSLPRIETRFGTQLGDGLARLRSIGSH